jgi:HEPN domain-containing protein
VIEDFGCYARPFHTALIRDERLIAGIYTFSELPENLRDRAMQMPMVGKGCIYKMRRRWRFTRNGGQTRHWRTTRFFLQGQVLRVAKNVGDKQNAEEWRTQFASIQDGLDQLKKQQAAPATVHVPAARVKVRTHAPTVRVSNKSEYFLESARKSFASDFYHPAALTAAMAFEAAAREAGLRLGLPENRPMTELVRNIAAVEGDPQLEQTLLTLVRLRNNLVHPSPSSEAVSAEKAQQLIEAFADGIKRLETAWPQ